MINLVDETPRFVFFTGKGGVGKTSLACATAVHLADQGRRVLLVSTDPASNVGQVFGVTIGNHITAIGDVPGLDALEMDPEEAAQAYRDRTLAPVRDLLSPADLAAVTEQLSGSCTTEIASFNEFTALLADESATDGYDHVVFDTAPTGHTVRLLQLPGEWTQFLDDGLGDASCLGPMSGLEKTRGNYAAALAALGDPTRTRLVLVARPQPSSLAEAARTSEELAQTGIAATHLVINGVLPDEQKLDGLADAVREREQAAIAALPGELAALAQDQFDLAGHAMVGVEALRGLLSTNKASGIPTPEPAAAPRSLPDLSALIEELAVNEHGLIMCMGKGGVGKTTIAAAIATALADRGKDVLLTTTDPAAHLADTLAEDAQGLDVSRIDPDEATRQYRDRVMATKGASLDDQGRAALAEDLRSPCTEEVAVFQAFSRAVSEASRRFVVMDTAPTGHTLLLMDATGSYHRDVTRNLAQGVNFTTPMMRLQDPDHTKIVIVTLPETTPVLEAQQLQDDLRRADIEPWAWVVNQALTDSGTTSPLLRLRASNEATHLETVTGTSERVALVPLQQQAPIGRQGLLTLTQGPAQLVSTR
ncbi:arsenical pump-driving ATPase [Propionibacteriaceae bacterium G57]|uniref:arsenical pump-driving ATPase n=1 Tax=Aestuariimicrobium sp. G57 TaxID=3418485 RepID=UPI003DA73FE0